MGFGFQRNDRFEITFCIISRNVGPFRGKLLHYRPLNKGHIIFIGRYNIIRVLLRCFFNELKKRYRLLHAIDDEAAIKYFVAAMFRIYLRKAEHL
ncbi:hypothetical protein D9M68_665040 [compost metagenome]